jgi:uncharacterized membrane protein
MVETSAKREAQERVDRIHAFLRELNQLTQEGALVLAPEERQRLDAHLEKTLVDLAGRFDVDISDSQKKFSMAMRIASALGGLALCAAVFLFFFRYWGSLSTPVQVSIVILIPILALIATEIVSRKEKTYYYTSLLAIVAFASFVMNLNVLGSIFNMAPTATAFLAWGLLGLFLAYGYRLKLQLAAGLISMVIFLAAQILSLSGGSWDAVLDRPETLLAGGIILLTIPSIFRHQGQPGFLSIYRLLGLLLLFLTLLILGNEGQQSFLPLSKGAVQGLYQMFGFGAALAAIWIGVRKGYAESLNLGAAFFAIYLFNRLFVWWWDWMPKYLFFLILGGLALALLAVFRRIRTRFSKPEAA